MSVAKKHSVWLNFGGPDTWDVMAAGGRGEHQISRRIFYQWMETLLKNATRPLEWCDVGVVSMVDYKRMSRSRFADVLIFTGLELSEKVAARARQELKSPRDGVIVGNLDDPNLPTVVCKRFEVISARHVLNHCEYYEQPLLNIHAMLKPGGWIFVTLQLRCTEDRDYLERHSTWSVPGEVIGNRYQKRRLLGYFGDLFWVEDLLDVDSEFDERGKPNQILIGRKRETRTGVARLSDFRIIRERLPVRMRLCAYSRDVYSWIRSLLAVCLRMLNQ